MNESVAGSPQKGHQFPQKILTFLPKATTSHDGVDSTFTKERPPPAQAQRKPLRSLRGVGRALPQGKTKCALGFMPQASQPPSEKLTRTVSCFHRAGSELAARAVCPAAAQSPWRCPATTGGCLHSPDSGSLPIIKTLGKFITISCWRTSYRNKGGKDTVKNRKQNLRMTKKITVYQVTG